MACRNVMKSALKCASPATTIEDAAVMMRDFGIGFLPVCDAANHVLGTITDRDIATRVVANREATDQPVGRFMTRRVIACRPEDSLERAEDLMKRARVSRVMCVNEERVLEGIISLSDIAQVEDATRAFETLRAVTLREVRA